MQANKFLPGQWCGTCTLHFCRLPLAELSHVAAPGCQGLRHRVFPGAGTAQPDSIVMEGKDQCGGQTAIRHHLQQLFFPPEEPSTFPLPLYLASQGHLLPASSASSCTSSTPLSSLILHKGLGPHPSFPTLWVLLSRLTLLCVPDPNPSWTQAHPPRFYCFSPVPFIPPPLLNHPHQQGNTFHHQNPYLDLFPHQPVSLSCPHPLPQTPEDSGPVFAVHSSSLTSAALSDQPISFPNPTAPMESLLARSSRQ